MVTRHDAVLVAIPLLAGAGFLADRLAAAAGAAGAPLSAVGLVAALLVVAREVLLAPGL